MLGSLRKKLQSIGAKKHYDHGDHRLPFALISAMPLSPS